jgi:hypothetical protein
MADFRLCSIGKSHSHVRLYHYALKLSEYLLEPTFTHLRYSLGNYVHLLCNILVVVFDSIEVLALISIFLFL